MENIIKLKKNLIEGVCKCNNKFLINKFSKTELFCDFCMATLCVPGPNKCKITFKINPV